VKFGEPIAIVGLGGVFPGARSLDEFWQIIAAGRDTSRPAPAGRWRLNPADILHPTPGTPDRVYTDRACFIEGFSLDPTGLAIDRDLLAQLDPVVHLLLAAGRDAFASAKTNSLDRSRIGVTLGHIALPTESSSKLCEEILTPLLEELVLGSAPGPGAASRALAVGSDASENGSAPTSPAADVRRDGAANSTRGACSPRLQTHPLNRYVAGLPAGLLAQALGLGGGTRTLDAACASSLYALKLACDELHAGRVDAMLAGGVSRPDSLYTQMGFAQLRALATTGRCTPFDAAASGLIVGEGAGVVVLKRLSKALRDGDEIHALIRGIGLSNDLDGNLLSPASEGQLRALRLAYEAAGWEPESVEFIECHATGTPVGDAVEFSSLSQLWSGRAWQPGQCALGAVKANVGHLLTGAGAAGLLKVLLSLRHNTLPPVANFQKPSDKIPLAQSPFRVLTQSQPWEKRSDGRPRRAALNGFGFGGINAHVLIEEWCGQAEHQTSLRCSRREGALTESAIGNRQSAIESAPIAIIGLATHIGPWRNLRSFTARVLGADTESQPTARRDWRGLHPEAFAAQPGHFVDDLALPVSRYRIPPRELAELLPQQALMLEVARDALADARVTEPDATRTGVFIGLGLDLRTTDFHFRWSMLDRASDWANRLPADVSEQDQAAWAARVVEAANPPLNADRTMGALAGTNASRIAKEFCIGGQSYTVCSEDTSGLSALEIAVRVLQRGELDLALAGGVELTGDLRARRAETALGKVELPGEGAVAIILKRLDDAHRDGDRIYAVIRGLGTASAPAIASSASHSSYSSTATARALSEAGLTKATPIPSAATEVGHTGSASGLVDLAKAVLALHAQVLPATSASAPQLWLRDRADGPRRATITTPSVDGNVVSVVLEAPEANRLAPTGGEGRGEGATATNAGQRFLTSAATPRPETLFTLAAVDTAGLLAQLDSLRRAAAASPSASLDKLARRSADDHVRSPNALHRAAFIAQDRAQLTRLLDAAEQAIRVSKAEPLDHRARDRLFFTPPAQRVSGKVAFVFPGAGNHFADMGRELGLLFPEVLRAQDRENERLASQLFAAQFWNATAPVTDQRTSICGQVALGAFVSDIAVSLGLKPDAAIGYSLGESTSLFALRAWTARDEMLARVTASTLFTQDLTGEPAALRRAWKTPAKQKVSWLAGLVDRPADAVRAAMTGLARTYILIVNTPSECVIGGDAEQVRALVAKLGCHFFALDGVSTVHCDLLQPVLEAYRELHRFPTTPPAGVTFYSGGWGRSYLPDRETAADAIVAQASATINFPRVVRAAYDDGIRFFIEMGPGASCSRMVGQILENQPHFGRSLCVSAKEPLLDVLRVAGALWAEGLPLNLEPLYGAGEAEAAPKPEGKKVIIPITGAPIVPPPLPQGSARVSRAGFGVPPNPPVTPFFSDACQGISVEQGFQRDAENSTPEAWALQDSLPSATLAEGSTNTADPFEAEFLTAMAQVQATTLQAHEAYLAFSEGVFKTLSEAVQTQLDLLARATNGEPLAQFTRGPLTPALSPGGGEGEKLAPIAHREAPASTVPRSLTREQCFEFAIGKIGKALGATFAEADSFPTRVRLPDAPLQLVDRITAIEGEPRSMTRGRVVTEHDVLPGAWYLDCGRIPTCIAVEAGQADLFLSSFLGIDFQTRGLAMYRLLDAKVCFHRSLPGPGETIRYDIRIERFFQQSGVWLFKFNFESTVNGQPLLTMTEGCAGFFTPLDLAAGKGVIRTALQLKPQPGKRPADWEDFVPMAVESYSAAQLDALREGDLVACFGEKFAGLKLAKPVTLPGGRMRLVHRIERLEPSGGRFGLGLIRGEADIHPDDWFITCHFVDDRVMPGTLMYECCLHTLRVHLLRLGWVVEARAGVALEPVPGVVGQLKCRGQVLETTKLVTYEIEIKEIGYVPEPYVIADALMYADSKAIVEIANMSLRYTGVTREQLRATWTAVAALCERRVAGTSRATDASLGGHRPPLQAQGGGERIVPTKPLFGPESICAFSSGNPSDAFGAAYRIFDADQPRRIARLPRAPYQFLDRITEIRGCEAFKMVAGGEVAAEYDVPADEWYFAANRQGDMPFAVLLEIALQPCGWLSAYLGSALTSSDDLSYRNLGGTGTQFAPVRPGVGTLTTRIKNTRLSSSAGMIIQWFDFEVSAGAQKIYRGDTYFGFFPKAALEKQEGIKGGKLYAPSAAELARAKSLAYPTAAPFADTMMRMVDELPVFIADGGPQRLGFIRGTKRVVAEEWFFQAHFYQDPVVPGSLGLESFLQLLKFAAVERWGHAATLRWEAVAMNTKHEWQYRGQVIPRDALVTVEAVVTAVNDEQLTLSADGFLSVDGRVIYGMKNFTVRGVSE
jgi:PfaB family protein